jgi:hypothetical protein
MLADELDYVVGVDTHWTSTSWRSWLRRRALWSRAGRCARVRAAIKRRSASLSATRLGRERGRLRAPATPGPGSLASSQAGARRCWNAAAHRGLNGGCAAKAMHWTRFERRVQRWAATRSRYPAPVSAARRCGCCWSRVAARSTYAAKKRLDSCAASSSPPRTAPGAAARAPVRKTAGALPPPAPLKHGKLGRARDQARPAQPRPTDPRCDYRGRRARTRDPRPRACARTGAARRAGRRPDRRRAADRRLITPRPSPLRSRHRASRRRRAGPRLERQENPAPTQPNTRACD